MPPSRSRGVSRREFVKAAVAIGGASALSACLGRENPDLPQGPDDLSALPRRQHAWNAALSTDDHGNHLQPRHHLLLYLDYTGDGAPSDADRETVETALRSLERSYPRRHEGEVGLLFTVGYAPAYFERFDAALPDGVDLPAPEPLAPFEDPAPDEPDAVVHLASDYGSVVLAAEEALLGEQSTLNGREMDATVEGVFERASLAEDGPNRRTGFIGAGLPADNQDVNGIPDSEPVPDDSPLYMGFKSGFEGNQASEDRVTIGSGPFAGGTTQHVSQIHLNLGQWYEQDSREQREATMFCPAHADEDRIEGVGDNLGTDTGVEACAEDLDSDAREKGVVGHSQKTATVREDGSPIILRRDFDSTDGGQAGVHFLSLQSSIADFVRTREAMNGSDLAEDTAVRQRSNNGILQYMSVRRRGNYLLPPRENRALPSPRPSE
ncbi:Tat pathway signal protein [Halosimplex aquaticum]|uniref:Tat pathway signal protein n=1 Tax=Halosimplex aquaticum TaxID=3026162 RepID=A0ABD5Y9J9_9EURY|nr:Tat pathway signal protein [Halosimplex aquaticum]